MTEKDKDLLLKDLCARLPHGVMLCIEDIADKYNDRLFGISFNHGNCLYINGLCVDNNGYDTYATIKPYLFPLSSMTEKQYENFIIISGWDGDYEDIKRGKFSCIGYIGLDYIYDTLDWLNFNHFDYRNLIERNLAIDCTNLNIY